MLERVSRPRSSLDLLGACGGPPALIGLERKSLTNPTEEDRCIQSAVDAHSGQDHVLPVVFGRKVVGAVQGERNSRRVTFWRIPQSDQKMWCTFSNYDDIIAAIAAGRFYPASFTKTQTTAPTANNWYDLWTLGGNPSAGSYAGAASTAVQYSDTTTGALYTMGNVSTQTKHIMSMWAVASGGVPTLIIYDRVLGYEANVYNAAAQKTMTNTLTAQRYVSAGQSGMKILTTVQTVNGATATNLTQLAYTNQAGTAGQAMPTSPTVSFIVSAAAPTSVIGARVICPATSGATLPWGPYLPLAAGDSGVRSIASFTTSAANTGTFAFILARPLFTIGTGTAGTISQLDGVMQIPNLERIYDGACLAFLAYYPAATACTWNGGLNVAWN